MKTPRGILGYNLTGHNDGDISWKITGNLGGESYQDRTRGPLNEGSMWAERQGYHLPNPPSQGWALRSPMDGIPHSGIGFYTYVITPVVRMPTDQHPRTQFNLDMPAGYDIPLSFVFPNISNSGNYRCQLYVNGYQFGKYGKCANGLFSSLSRFDAHSS